MAYLMKNKFSGSITSFTGKINSPLRITLRGFLLAGANMEKTGKNILVVDDEQDVVAILTGALARKGYTVKGALNGEEALKILQEQNTDLVLLDIIMPGMKGTEVAAITKDKYPGVKIVVITAFPEESENIQNTHITEGLCIKPFKLEELYKKIAETLQLDNITENRKEGNIDTKVIFIKADLLFVEPSREIFQFLRQRFEQLASHGQHYTIDAVQDETALFRKLTLFKPDIVIFEESYLRQLNARVPEQIFAFSENTKEVIAFNLSAAVSDLTELENLIEKIRSLCISHGLLEIK